MKDKVLFIAAVLTIMCFIGSCGSSRQPSSASQQSDLSVYGTAVASEPCMALQEQSPATRAWGNGEHFKLATASNIAEAQARAKFVKAIASSITASLEDYANGRSQYAGDDSEGQSVSDQAAKTDDYVKAVAEGMVKNAVIIKTTTYRKSNNQYNVFVCLEYQAGVESLANNITASIRNRIPEEERLRIDFDFEKFKQSVKEDLEKFGKENGQ